VARVIGNTGQVTRPSRLVHASPSSRWSADFRIVIPALAIGGCIVAGMGWNVAPLTTVGALAAIVVALVAPAIGLATIAFMGTLQPPLVIPAPGFNAILVGAVLFGCVYRLPIDRPRIRLTVPMLLLIGFVLYVGVQQTPEMIAGYAGDLGYLVYSNFRELLSEFAVVLAAVFVLTRRSPLPFIAVGLVSAILSAVLALVTFGNPAVGPPIAGLLAHSTLSDRAVGSFGNPNYFGLFEAIATITAVSWMIGTHSARLRLVLLVAAIVLGASLAVSLSRGGVIAFAAGLACLAFSRYRARTASVIVAGLLVAAVVLFPIFVDWRITTTLGSASAGTYADQAQSDAARGAAVLAGPQLFLTAPLFGIGWGHYSAMSAQFAGPGVSLGAHNWYISVLAEEGTVGIVIWILLLGALVIALRSRPTFPRSIGFGVLGTYAVGSLFLEAPTSFQTSALAILVIVAAMTSDWPAPLGAGRPPASDRQDRNASRPARLMTRDSQFRSA
jgi:O-antigen ligase